MFSAKHLQKNQKHNSIIRQKFNNGFGKTEPLFCVTELSLWKFDQSDLNKFH